VRAASEFVWSRQNAGGSWDSYWWTSPHYTTLQAVEFARLRSDRASVRRAAEWALRTQDGEGGWNAPDRADSAFATALGLSILVIADAAAAPVERAIDRLTALQDADGSWPSHPIMRIPLPGDRDPNGQHRWRPVRFASGIVVEDQHRTFTSAACVAALALAAAWVERSRCGDP
jgi:squalene-hopene/tetraprenyl-beta-curcumene cyclase